MLDSQRLDHLRSALGGDLDADLMLQRLRRSWGELERALGPARLERLLGVMGHAHRERPAELRRLDEARLGSPDWFQRPEMLGYECHPARFAGSLADVAGHVPYLTQLGVTWLHLLGEDTPEAPGLAALTRHLRAHGLSAGVDLAPGAPPAEAGADADAFVECAGRLLRLANQGVEVVRLGSAGQQPLGPLRMVARVVAPALVLIGGPDAAGDLTPHHRLMVQVWSSLASEDIRLCEVALEAPHPAPPPDAAWTTYLRGPEDIVWNLSDEEARRAGVTAEGHHQFLCDYYTGRFPGSDARGELREGRLQGSAACLAGLESALGRHDPRGTQEALERLLLGYAVVLGFGGVPLVAMGDELADLGDPQMDWARAEQARSEPHTISGRMYSGLRALITARQRTPQLHAEGTSRVVPSPSRHVLVLERARAPGPFVAVYNFSDLPRSLSTAVLRERGLGTGPVDRISGRKVALEGDALKLAPYTRLWLTPPG